MQPAKFKFEIDQKSSSSNLIFQTQFFKNQVQIDRRKRDPPLDHRVLDQRWISGRFLVDYSDSELFLLACHEKFLDCIYVMQCLFLDDIHTFRCKGNCMLNTLKSIFESRTHHLHTLCTFIISHDIITCHWNTD